MFKKLINLLFNENEDSAFISYYFFLCLTAILCFGFALNNPSMGIDDEMLYYISSLKSIFFFETRLGILITSKLIHSYEYLPFWREFIGVILYIIGITLHVDNFYKYLPSNKFDKNSAIIFACLALSFPYIAFNFIFMCTVIEQPLTILFSALAVSYTTKYFLINQNKKYIFYSFIFVFLIFSFYEIGIMYYILSSIFIILFNKIHDINSNNKEMEKPYNEFKWFCCLGFVSFLSIISNYIIIYIFKFLLNFNYLQNKFAEHFMYNVDSFLFFLNSFINNNISSLKNFIFTCKYDFGSLMILLSYIILFSLVIYLYWKKRNKIILLWGFLFLIFPLLPPLLAGNPSLKYRTIVYYGFFVPFVFVILYSIIKNNRYLKYVLYTFIFLCVLYQTKEMNQFFYTENIKYQNDKMLAFNVIQDIRKFNDKPVVIVGVRENPLLKHSYDIEAPEASISIFNWDRYDNYYTELFVERPFNFIREQGFSITNFFKSRQFEEDEIEYYVNTIKNAVKDMGIYPQRTSIKEMEDFILIKIGPSKFEE